MNANTATSIWAFSMRRSSGGPRAISDDCAHQASTNPHAPPAAASASDSISN